MAGTDDLMGGLNDLDEARPGYDLAWSYWRADVPEEFDSPQWRRILARSGGRFRVNMAAKTPVVALADRLKVAGLVAVGPEGRKDDDADAVLQREVWAANQLKLQSKRLIRNTLVFGDSYWNVWRGDTDGTCRVNYNSPLTTRAIYDPDDEMVMLHVIRRFVKAGRVRASLLYPDRLELGWILREDAKDPTDPKSWDREAGAQDVAHDYGRPPVFHFRTDLPYGTPEHEDAWGAQDAINKLTATMAHTSERAGLRDRWALANPNAALNSNAGDSPIWDDDGDADEDTRDDALPHSGPGEIQRFTGIDQLGEWSAPEPSGFMASADWFISAAAKVTRTPGRYADPGGQHPSGAALRAADAPLDAKTEDRQDFLTEELQAAGEFGLLVCGLPDRRVVARWKPSGLVDDLDTWSIVQAKISAGVPERTALMETGLYEADVVDGWLADSQVEMAVGRRVSLLGDFAAAVAQLGQGVLSGILDEAQAREVVQLTVGQLTPEVDGDSPA